MIINTATASGKALQFGIRKKLGEKIQCGHVAQELLECFFLQYLKSKHFSGVNINDCFCINYITKKKFSKTVLFSLL